jgi:hypothetical protein
VTADPDEASAHNDRGPRLADQELFDQAIQEYRQADKLWQKAASKDRKRTLCNWADGLREQEHYEPPRGARRPSASIGNFPTPMALLGKCARRRSALMKLEQYRQADSKDGPKWGRCGNAMSAC